MLGSECLMRKFWRWTGLTVYNSGGYLRPLNRTLRNGKFYAYFPTRTEPLPVVSSPPCSMGGGRRLEGWSHEYSPAFAAPRRLSQAGRTASEGRV